jgi:hypothetical protein
LHDVPTCTASRRTPALERSVRTRDAARVHEWCLSSKRVVMLTIDDG